LGGVAVAAAAQVDAVGACGLDHGGDLGGDGDVDDDPVAGVLHRDRAALVGRTRGAQVDAGDERRELGRLLLDLLGELLVLFGQGRGLTGGVVDPLLDLTGQVPLLVLGCPQLLVLDLGLAPQLLGLTGGVLGGDALGGEVVLGRPQLVDHVLLAVRLVPQQGLAQGRLVDVGGVEHGGIVALGRADVGVDGGVGRLVLQHHDLRLEAALLDPGGLGLGQRRAGGPLGVLVLGPLAAHVLVEGGEGVLQVGGVGPQPVQLGGHVGGLLPDRIPLGPGVVGLLGLDQDGHDREQGRGGHGQDGTGQGGAGRGGQGVGLRVDL